MTEVGVRVQWRWLRLVVWLAFWPWLALAAQAGAVTEAQGYNADSDIAAGSLVCLSSGDTKKVVSATIDQTDNLVGVVVTAAEAALTISPPSGKVDVATSGVIATFVSDVNGDIKPGDRITTSPIAGVGMKATSSTRVVGTAQGSFSSTTAGASRQLVKDKNGQSHTVAVGSVDVLVQVGSFVVAASNANSPLPQPLQNLANTIAGKPVPVVRVIGGAVILLFAFIAVSALLYSSVRNSIISIGRNPLSQSAVYRSLAQVFLVSLGIMLLALAAVYILVTR